MSKPIQKMYGQIIWGVAESRKNRNDCIKRIENSSLVRFKGHWYSAFHEGVIHNVHPRGRSRIIRSDSGEEWETVAVFDWEGGDVRDVSLSLTAEGHLLANAAVVFASRQPRGQIRASATGGFESYTPPEGVDPDGESAAYHQLDWLGTVLNLSADDLEHHSACQSVTWLTTDGVEWSTAFACPSGVNTWRWAVTWHNGMGYSLAQWGKDCRGPLYRTRDGKNWRILADCCAPEGKCNEGSLAFGGDDTAYCLLRGRGQAGVVLGVGEAPYYQNWKWAEPRINYGPEHPGLSAQAAFRVSLGGPKILRLSDGRLVGAGRALGPDRENGRVTLFWIDPVNTVFDVFAECDGTGYPGIVEHEGKLWVTFTGRECEEGLWNIRLASIEIPA